MNILKPGGGSKGSNNSKSSFNGTQKENSTREMQSPLMILFEKKLKDSYWAEQALIMETILKEAKGLVESCEPGAMPDAGIISARQRVGQYESAAYGTYRQPTETLSLTEAIVLLEIILHEGKAADEKLSDATTDENNHRSGSR